MIDALLDYARPPFGSTLMGEAGLPAGTLGDQLDALLRRRNGFCAFGSALHVFSVREAHIWNDPSGWKGEYGDAAAGLWFFAEDIFGFPFAIGDRISQFDPETAEVTPVAADLDGWAAAILGEDGVVLTGATLARRWQDRFGPIPPGHRLAPKYPPLFILGAAFDVDGMYPAETQQLMAMRVALWQQIKDLPEGAEVEIELEQ